MILIISSPKDVHTQKVCQHLESRNQEYFIWDFSLFPSGQRLSVSYENGTVRMNLYDEISNREIEFKKISSAWWRRPQPFGIASGMKDHVNHNFALGECHATISAVWKLISARWMNPPAEDEMGSRKAYQLQVAKSVGLTIPDTIVTNNPYHAKAFIEKHAMNKGTIYKSFSATEEAWRETRLIKEHEMTKLDNVKYAPVIFQEYIQSVADLRITVVGDKIFPAEIVIPDSSYQIDFRMTYSTSKISPHRLPEAVSQKLLSFMKKLNLVYGAIDMRLTPDGKYVFLEVNTAGQWLFMEEPTGLPITETIANWLANAN